MVNKSLADSDHVGMTVKLNTNQRGMPRCINISKNLIKHAKMIVYNTIPNIPACAYPLLMYPLLAHKSEDNKCSPTT